MKRVRKKLICLPCAQPYCCKLIENPTLRLLTTGSKDNVNRETEITVNSDNHMTWGQIPIMS